MDSMALANNWQSNLIQSIEVGILIIEKDYSLRDWNKFMQNHTNRAIEDVAGQSIFSIFPELDKNWFQNKCDPVFSVKTPMFILWEQRPYLFKFESARPITSVSEFMYQNVTIFPVQNSAGEVEKLCVLVYDVTDQAISKQKIELLNAELEKSSRIDGLTGLFNRRYWQERFESDYKLAQRNENTPATLMMLDIDHFKKVNDTHGHQGGDSVIIKLADIIRETMRETDVVGRFGGEEFSILLPNTDINSAQIVAERLRKKCEDSTSIYDNTPISFKVSIGLAQFKLDYTTPMLWLEEADQALYSAKFEGRNRVCTA